jgi:polyhydroxybutyrate depolymerase
MNRIEAAFPRRRDEPETRALYGRHFETRARIVVHFRLNFKHNTMICKVSSAFYSVFLILLLGASRVSAVARQEVDIVYASGEDRDPITLYIPDVSVPGEDNATNVPPDVPLIVLLHGRCMDGESTNRILRFTEQVDSREFILALPEGTRNRFWCSSCTRLGGILNTRYGCRSWAATPACCAAGRFSLRPGDPETWEPVDDVEHLAQVIRAVKSQYNVAEDKVYIVGWENGGFMAYRMACEKPDLISGIVSISGLTFADAQSNCAAFTATTKTPVNVLAIHGELDNIPVDGGRFEGKPVPSVEQTLAGWADHNGCDASAKVTTADALVSRQKLLPNNPDTDLVHFGNTSQCDVGGRTELRLVSGLNTELATALTFTADFGPSLIDWMLETDGVSNNGFVDDDDLAPAPGPSVETSSGPNGFTHCPPDVLRCPDGEMVTRQVPNCDFQCSSGAPTLSYLESICTANDCCGTYGLCLSTSKCADTSCPNDITLENYDAYMSARDNEPRSSGAPAGVAAALTFGSLVAFATLI